MTGVVTDMRYLNLGCGRVLLPAYKPAHHAIVSAVAEFYVGLRVVK